MSVITQIAISLASWFAIMFVSTNLIGLLLRVGGNNSEMHEIASSNEFLSGEIQKSQRSGAIIAIILVVAFLSALYYFWNVGLVIAGIMLMLSRAPDAIWEMKNDRPLGTDDMRKPKFFMLSTLLAWTSLAVVWYSLYRL